MTHTATGPCLATSKYGRVTKGRRFPAGAPLSKMSENDMVPGFMVTCTMSPAKFLHYRNKPEQWKWKRCTIKKKKLIWIEQMREKDICVGCCYGYPWQFSSICDMVTQISHNSLLIGRMLGQVGRGWAGGRGDSFTQTHLDTKSQGKVHLHAFMLS